jgi:hypothetical protein
LIVARELGCIATTQNFTRLVDRDLLEGLHVRLGAQA